MSDRYFVDTNVLVYAYDSSEPVKKQLARNLIRDGIRNERAAISVQGLGEFFTVVTRRIDDPFSIDSSQQIIQDLKSMAVVELDTALVDRAIDTCKRYEISYWDGLIVAAAERAWCNTVYTEDLNSKQVYWNVQAVNPFVS